MEFPKLGDFWPIFMGLHQKKSPLPRGEKKQHISPRCEKNPWKITNAKTTNSARHLSSLLNCSTTLQQTWPQMCGFHFKRNLCHLFVICLICCGISTCLYYTFMYLLAVSLWRLLYLLSGFFVVWVQFAYVYAAIEVTVKTKTWNCNCCGRGKHSQTVNSVATTMTCYILLKFISLCENNGIITAVDILYNVYCRMYGIHTCNHPCIMVIYCTIYSQCPKLKHIIDS